MNLIDRIIMNLIFGLCCGSYYLLIQTLKAANQNNQKLDKLLQQGGSIMSQIDDLNAAVQGVRDDVNSVQADVTSVLALLKQTPPDVSGAIAALQSIDTDLKGVDTGLKAALPQTPPATS